MGGRAVTVRLIGYWRSDCEPHWPDSRSFVDASWDESERDVVAGYLETGGFVPWGQCGFSECRFCGALNGSEERCDGVYIWPEGLPHYIREHNLRLPAEVVEHILSAAHSSDQNAVRRAKAALEEDLSRLQSAGDQLVFETFVIDEGFWAHTKLG